MYEAYLQLIRKAISPIKKRLRDKRWRMFVQEMQPHGGSVIDLGGKIESWSGISSPLDLTLLNLPDFHGEGTEWQGQSHHRVIYLEGDACCVSLPDRSFDLVFSSSVIEHVGDANKQAAFANEVRRLGCGYWVQTPSRWFPLEPHSLMPFWWFYPAALRRFLIGRWRRNMPNWADMVAESRVLSKTDLRKLFPEAHIAPERLLGLPKSYIAFARFGSDEFVGRADALEDAPRD